MPISGPIITAKAKLFHTELQIKKSCDFSSGWLKGFKRRHGIWYLKESGEKLSADKEAADELIDDFVQKISDEENLSPEQLFNMDETGLFWRCFPRKTCNKWCETAPSGVKEVQRRE